MYAATPPSFWVSAMICTARVDLPADSPPYISVTLPRGIPPVPRARSRLSEPVGIDSVVSLDATSPSRMTAPFP